MNKVVIFVMCFLLFFAVGLSYSQEVKLPSAITVNPSVAQTKTLDINKDGVPDVIYYRDGGFIDKVEADTNYDGRHDVLVNVKDGKFESAEVDFDYDGKPDKKFTDQEAFKKWLNENRPDFKDALDKADWRFDLMKF